MSYVYRAFHSYCGHCHRHSHWLIHVSQNDLRVRFGHGRNIASTKSLTWSFPLCVALSSCSSLTFWLWGNVRYELVLVVLSAFMEIIHYLGYFDDIHLPPPLNSSPFHPSTTLLPFPTSCPFRNTFLRTINSNSWSPYTPGQGTIHWSMVNPLRSHGLKESKLSPRNHQLSITPHFVGQSHLASSWAGLVQTLTAAACSREPLAVPSRRLRFTLDLSDLWILMSFCPLIPMVLKPWRGHVMYDL